MDTEDPNYSEFMLRILACAPSDLWPLTHGRYVVRIEGRPYAIAMNEGLTSIARESARRLRGRMVRKKAGFTAEMVLKMAKRSSKRCITLYSLLAMADQSDACIAPARTRADRVLLAPRVQGGLASG